MGGVYLSRISWCSMQKSWIKESIISVRVGHKIHPQTHRLTSVGLSIDDKRCSQGTFSLSLPHTNTDPFSNSTLKLLFIFKTRVKEVPGCAVTHLTVWRLFNTVTTMSLVIRRVCLFFCILLTGFYGIFDIISIYHKYEGGIEKSIPRITDWHHKACQVTFNITITLLDDNVSWVPIQPMNVALTWQPG